MDQQEYIRLRQQRDELMAGRIDWAKWIYYSLIALGVILYAVFG